MKLIVVLGPTGSSKTRLSYEIAKKFNLEIINADAFQVYKEINVGINKPSKYILNKIKHHLINVVSIYDEWNIKIFKDRAEEIIDKSKKPLIVSGGSNLYVHALLKNYNLSNTGRKNNYNNFTNDEIYNTLYKIDEVEAKKIGINNRKSLIRAIEIIEETNILKSNISLYNKKEKYDYFIIFINPNRERLYNKLNLRTEKMFSDKIIKELNSLNLNKFKKSNASKAIGYKRIIDNNLIINEEIMNKIKQDTRNYSKRQISWMKKFDIDIIVDDYKKNIDKIFNELEIFLERKKDV